MASPNDRIYTLEKAVGETPLQALERSREERGFPPYVKMAYAGRLDPMAEGKLLVLTGRHCDDVAAYTKLDKGYSVSVVLGVASDSHDVLGRLTDTRDFVPRKSEHDIRAALGSFVGHYDWPYPVFSSKPVDGKPLFQWFLEGKIDEIEVPHSTGRIYNIRYTQTRVVSPEELKARTLEKVHSLAIVTEESKRLGRDFRRHEVLDSWHAWHQTRAQSLQVVDIEVFASSGTYMRTLADELGKKLGVGGLALEIHRTHIGTYVPLGFLGGFWWRQY